MEAQKFTMLNEIDVLKTSPSTMKEFDGRLFGFKMISFESLIDKDISLKSTFDIIGHVVHVFKSNASNVKDKNKRTIEISDLRGNCVYLTPWDNYASELSKYVIEHFDEGHVIIVLQFGRVKYYTGSDGKEKVYVSNSFGYNVACFFINDFLFEIEEYKNSLVDLLNGNDVAVRKPIMVKMLSSVDDEFLRATYFFNIGDICTIIFPKSIIILGTIKAICPDTEWFKIKIREQDSTGVVSLTLFDRDAKMLTKKTTKELIDSQNENKVDVVDFNFRNNVEDYGINKLTDDTNIIKELQKRLNGRLQSDSNSVTLGASISEFQSSGSVSIKVSDIGDNQTPSSNVNAQDVATDAKGMSTSSDDKLKRKLVEVFEVEDDASMSATKMKSKTTKEMETTSESCEGATLLTPKVEK
ncbi:uncharacterized protein LOC143598916 [Bidens hawaiensis]|uniref:uncharacterized protein LOC143598916 n=1 Tax=Bidens hawaiensis TaxID=980011 RepID=UPI00404B2904